MNILLEKSFNTLIFAHNVFHNNNNIITNRYTAINGP